MRRGWMVPGVLSIAAHVSVFTVMPSASRSAAIKSSVLMRVQDPPPPPPPPKEPPVQVVAKKPPPPKEPPPKEPPPKKLEKPELTTPPPPKPEATPPPKLEPPADAPVKTTNEVALPGPATPQAGTGPAAGNSAMLGESRPPTTAIAEGAPAAEKREGVLTPGAKRDLADYHRRIYDALKNAPNFYPSAARRLGLEGRARIKITVDRQGRVLAKKLIQSTGHALLDQRALQLIDERSPFPPLPESYEGPPVEYTVPVTFRLTDE